jgi:hypothetical protein
MNYIYTECKLISDSIVFTAHTMVGMLDPSTACNEF